ncbi:hypothetical protein BH11PSE8_BH11PSE8_40310 [soil metagenome]
MSAASNPADLPLPGYRRARFLVRGLRSVGFGVVIAAAMTAMGAFSFWINLVHSVCIAVLCWASIDLMRIPVARWKHRNDPLGSPEAQSHWPGWPLMMATVVVGTLFGFSAGGSIAGWLTGHPNGGLLFMRNGWLQGAGVLMTALIPGTLITYWFYAREKMAMQEAAIQLAQRQAAEHQLKLLESQLEPHMLFNTLANLRVLIGMDPPRAQAMLDQLIAFLRATLSGSRASSHPLSAEFARLADYLALMQIRMGERLRTQFELPEALSAVTVPPLLLQPLVENCIKHGLEPQVEGGQIIVSAAHEATPATTASASSRSNAKPGHADRGQLVLRVRDTGLGLAPSAGDGTRFGLVQVRERLATLYGTAASLELSEPVDGQGGALATIRLPMPETTTP